MAPTTRSTSTSTPTPPPPPSPKIPTFYRLFFLYIDPLLCISGIYLMYFDHHSYLHNGGAPSHLAIHHPVGTPLPPSVTHLIYSLGAVFLFFFTIQVVLLQTFKDNVKVWKIVEGGILATDAAMLGAFVLADPGFAVRLGGWGHGDWVNNGILAGLVVIRSSFVLGVGF